MLILKYIIFFTYSMDDCILWPTYKATKRSFKLWPVGAVPLRSVSFTHSHQQPTFHDFIATPSSPPGSSSSLGLSYEQAEHKYRILKGRRSVDTDDFFIEVKSKAKLKRRPLNEEQFIYYTNSTYYFNIDETLEFTCNNKVSFEVITLQWMDQNGFSTGEHEDYQMNSLKLKLTPDIDDDKAKLLCISHVRNEEKKIVIQLKAKPPKQGNKRFTVNIANYIKEADPVFANATCNATVYFPNNVSPTIYFTNEEVIYKFTEEFKGTVMYCYNYEPYSTDDVLIPTYEREKRKMTLHLQTETTVKPTGEGQTWSVKREIQKSGTSEKNKTNNLNVGFFCFGLIGIVIILVNMAILTVLCLRKKKTSRQTTNAVRTIANQACVFHLYETIQEATIHLPRNLSQSSLGIHPGTDISKRPPYPPPREEIEGKEPYNIHYDTPYEWRIFRRGVNRLSARESWINYKAKQMKGSFRQ